MPWLSERDEDIAKERARTPHTGLAVAGILVLAVAFTTQVHYWVNLFPAVDITWLQAVLAASPQLLTWGLSAPLIVWLSDRFPIDQENAVPRLILHTALSFAVALLVIGVIDVSDHLLHWSTLMAVPGYLVSGFRYGIIYLHMGVAIYWVVLAARHATGYYGALQERELMASRLEAQLARGQLSALRSQLQPHFLFNALNSVAVLMRRDTAGAETMLHRISELLRATLETSDAQLLPLSRELDLVRAYLGVEETRFQGRLAVRVDVGADVGQAMVPNLLLQPLVENALRHGIAPLASGGTIEIGVRRVDARVEITVRDDGAGFGDAAKASEEGIGLANTRRRLEALYGDDHGFDIRSPDEGGTIVTVTIPYRVESDEPEVEAEAKSGPGELEPGDRVSESDPRQ